MANAKRKARFFDGCWGETLQLGRENDRNAEVGGDDGRVGQPVSYTHLTLPTIA